MGKACTQQKHKRRCNHKGQERPFFILVETRSHKAPHLESNHRKGHRKPEHHRDAEQRKQVFLRRCVLKCRGRITQGPQGSFDRGQQEIQDVNSNEIAANRDEADAHPHQQGQNRADEPRSEFGQMLDQRGRAVVDLFCVAHALSFSAASAAGCCAASARARASAAAFSAAFASASKRSCAFLAVAS